MNFWDRVNLNGPVNPALGTGCWLWTGSVDAKGYGRHNGTIASRYAWEQIKGSACHMFVDHHHLCPKTCVNVYHLRLVSPKQNLENLARPYQTSASGVRGVRWHKGAWEAYVTHNGKQFYLGRFSNREQAESAAITKRNELFTHNDMDRERCGT